MYMYMFHKVAGTKRELGWCVPDPTVSATAVATCPPPFLACACSGRSESAWLEARLPCRKCFPSGSECIYRSIYNSATPMLWIRDEVRLESQFTHCWRFHRNAVVFSQAGNFKLHHVDAFSRNKTWWSILWKYRKTTFALYSSGHVRKFHWSKQF